MRQGSNSGRRPRGRTNRKQHGGGGGGQSRTHTFDSNGPDGRVRGNARQVYEKYLTLARDASSAGDRIAAEAYYQHAEHYFRILNDSTDPQRRQEAPQAQQQRAADGEAESEANGNAEPGAEEATAKPNGTAASQSDQQDISQPGAEQPDIAADAVVANGQDGEGEAPQKPRRGRPRKPRAGDDAQPRKKEAASESESDTAAP